MKRRHLIMGQSRDEYEKKGKSQASNQSQKNVENTSLCLQLPTPVCMCIYIYKEREKDDESHVTNPSLPRIPWQVRHQHQHEPSHSTTPQTHQSPRPKKGPHSTIFSSKPQPPSPPWSIKPLPIIISLLVSSAMWVGEKGSLRLQSHLLFPQYLFVYWFCWVGWRNVLCCFILLFVDFARWVVEVGSLLFM